MNNDIVAKRYATALFQLAKEQNLLDQIEQNLRVIKKEFTTNKELVRFLQLPNLTAEVKKEFIGKVFASAETPVINFLSVLIDRHRDGLIAPMVDYYIEQANDARDLAEATVYSIRPLSKQEQAVLSSTFAKKVNKKALKITNVIDTDLLGGIKVRIGNTIYDGSLSSKLAKVQRELLVNRI